MKAYLYDSEEQLQTRVMRLPENLRSDNQDPDIFRVLHGSLQETEPILRRTGSCNTYFLPAMCNINAILTGTKKKLKLLYALNYYKCTTGGSLSRKRAKNTSPGGRSSPN